MQDADELRKLRAHVDNLEWRLSEYHEKFRENADSRDRLAHDAAWGVASSTSGIIAFVAFFLLCKQFFELDSWVVALFAGIGGTIVQFVASGYADSMRMKEQERMREFPEWEWKSIDDND